MSASNGELYTGLNGRGSAPADRWPKHDGYHDAERDDYGHHDAGPHDAGQHDYQAAPEPGTGDAAQRAPWKRKRHRREFAGDVAAAELRTRLSMAPDRIAEPPPSNETSDASYGAWRMTGAAAVVVLGVGGYLWVHASNTAAASRDIVPVAASAGPAPTLFVTPRGEAQFAPATFESQPLAREMPIQPPPAVTTRSAAIALPPPVAAEQTATVAKAPPAAQVRRANAAEIAMMMKQGERFMANSDVSGARLVFQRAAEAGEPAAALALAETYDPLVLGATGARAGLIPDVAAARGWYERARALGSPTASDRLARIDQQ